MSIFRIFLLINTIILFVEKKSNIKNAYTLFQRILIPERHKLKLLTYMAPFSVNITRFSYG